MIDTDKIMRTTKILLHGRHINKNEADDYLELIAEVERLRKRLIRAYDWAVNAVYGSDSSLMDYIEHVCGGEEE